MTNEFFKPLDAALSIIQTALDSYVYQTFPAMALRGYGMKYSQIQIELPMQPDPFPCITIKYYPNGKDKTKQNTHSNSRAG